MDPNQPGANPPQPRPPPPAAADSTATLTVFLSFIAIAALVISSLGIVVTFRCFTSPIACLRKRAKRKKNKKFVCICSCFMLDFRCSILWLLLFRSNYNSELIRISRIVYPFSLSMIFLCFVFSFPVLTYLTDCALLSICKCSHILLSIINLVCKNQVPVTWTIIYRLCWPLVFIFSLG